MAQLSSDVIYGMTQLRCNIYIYTYTYTYTYCAIGNSDVICWATQFRCNICATQFRCNICATQFRPRQTVLHWVFHFHTLRKVYLYSTVCICRDNDNDNDNDFFLSWVLSKSDWDSSFDYTLSELILSSELVRDKGRFFGWTVRSDFIEAWVRR